MAYGNARFVIHYRDGSKFEEDRNDPHSWDNASKKDVLALGILPNPLVTGEIDRDGNHLRRIMPEHKLTASSKYFYAPFQMKLGEIVVVRGNTQITYGLRVGFVLDEDGKCICLDMKNEEGSYTFNTFYTTVYSLALNLDLLEIDLGECGKEIDDNRSNNSI